MGLLLLFMAFNFILVGAALALPVFFMRKSVQFGVTFPEEAHDLADMKKLRNGFARTTSLLCLVFMAPLAVVPLLDLGVEWVAYLGTALLLLYVFAAFFVYVRYHKRAKAIKERDFASDLNTADARLLVATDFRADSFGVSNNVLLGWGLAIILLTSILPFLLWDSLPADLVTHWDFAGRITTLRPRTVGTVLMLPFFQLFMLPIFLFANYSMIAGKQVLNPKKAKISLAQSKAFRRAWSRYVMGLSIGVLLLFAVLQVMSIFAMEYPFVMGFITIASIVAPMAPIFYLMARYGQGGERYQPKDREPEDPSAGGILDNDRFWKWGMFYYNPQDPSIFVEKRFGIGMTNNWARPASWWLLGGILLITALSAIIPLLFL